MDNSMEWLGRRNRGAANRSRLAEGSGAARAAGAVRDSVGPDCASEKAAGNSLATFASFRGEGVKRPEAASQSRIPDGVRAAAGASRGEYDRRRLRSQREIIRDVMLSAAECETWLTLGELRALTRYGEASISAQLRHLRKAENGGYEVVKRHREGASLERPGTDGRGECVWEYLIARGAPGPATPAIGASHAAVGA